MRKRKQRLKDSRRGRKKNKRNKKRNAKKRNKRRQKLAASQRRIRRRLDAAVEQDGKRPVFRARNIRYELAERNRAISHGGIGLAHMVAQQTGLVDEINERVEVLKQHKPYHESDHVLNIAYNILCGGQRLEDIEIRRNNEVFLDALGTESIPDPTTAGDFCRRFDEGGIENLMEAINEARLAVWRKQPETFTQQTARIDADGSIVETLGECKQGIDIFYKGIWGYHPLVVSLANTQEPLYFVNRSGSRPSHEGAAAQLDKAINLCRRAGFEKILLRGDTDFTQTKHHQEKQALLRMEFRSFLQAFIEVPAQIVKTGRRIIYRFLSWNPWQRGFFRLTDSLLL